MLTKTQTPHFAPQLHIPNGTTNIDFYINCLGAVELRNWKNEDGSVHVSELSIDGTVFHLHQENTLKGMMTPEQCKGVTNIVGLFVEDVDTVMNQAIAAGAVLVSEAQDYDYGYLQGDIRDPFGHLWMMQKKI